jgi:hypothetical protein
VIEARIKFDVGRFLLKIPGINLAGGRFCIEAVGINRVDGRWWKSVMSMRDRLHDVSSELKVPAQ